MASDRKAARSRDVWRYADKLRRLMSSRGCSQSELALATGVSQGAISRALSGGILPRPANRRRIGEFFGLDANLDSFPAPEPPPRAGPVRHQHSEVERMALHLAKVIPEVIRCMHDCLTRAHVFVGAEGALKKNTSGPEDSE